MTTPPTVLVASSVHIDDVRAMLRRLAEAGATPSEAGQTRTWAILGELAVADGLTENESVVEHDRLGRQIVRLAVDKTLCVGRSRAVRALHQGTVMEGSWGDEVRMVATAGEARDLLTSEDWRPGPGDVILLAAEDPGIAGLATLWPARDGNAGDSAGHETSDDENTAHESTGDGPSSMSTTGTNE
ncbi:UDP-N-acetylmuramoyl-tripeptide--D-alanyl-D-alanine ligase [Gordonia hankookensis]|uniref:UDP-N-acetylmuramoyl-tripeptide--D-alanyl-D-alanine ligase n=1 Tax=Gordonia hankookensis TaxID=589403 RepID=A0ABR7W8Q0_9ACTN|nr:UDP-N-acetylmuramoyl-tripeptide--D-alanyl-D-alanine ligase [Gordonia hankookensis]